MLSPLTTIVSHLPTCNWNPASLALSHLAKDDLFYSAFKKNFVYTFLNYLSNASLENGCWFLHCYTLMGRHNTILHSCLVSLPEMDFPYILSLTLIALYYVRCTRNSLEKWCIEEIILDKKRVRFRGKIVNVDISSAKD